MKAITANPTYTAAKLATYGYLGFALYLSFSHIIGLFAGLGSHHAWVAPLLLDTLILLGKVIRTADVTITARRAGRGLQYFGAAASLTANILAGDNPGDRIIGAMVIIGFLIVEWVSDHMQPRQVDDAAARAAKTASAVAKAKATRAANKAAAEAAEHAAAKAAVLRRERRAAAKAAQPREVQALVVTAAPLPQLEAEVTASPVAHIGYL